MFPCHEEKVKWDDYGEFIKYENKFFFLSATATKNQFYFFLVIQNYVTEPLSDRRFKPSFQKDTCLS